MLKWCAYCQQFQGERAPFDDYAITHGMCETCAVGKVGGSPPKLVYARELQRIQEQLLDAGRREDLPAAARILEDALRAGMRPVDVLLGLLAPLLYRIGEDWKRGVITVAEEHRFTSFCARAFTLLEARVRSEERPVPSASALLLNAPGNFHTLALRTLASWLLGEGVEVRILDPPPAPNDVVAAIRERRPDLVLVSMALAEQRPSVEEIVAAVRELSPELRPRILIGGYAVKLGLVEAIAGAELIVDIHAISPSASASWKPDVG
jgi:methanogenic corrinoid protein MtbC1